MSKPVVLNPNAKSDKHTNLAPGNTPALDDASPEHHPQIQALIDTEARVAGGIFMYLALWGVITWATGLTSHQPMLVWSFAGFLTLVALLRMALKQQFPRLVKNKPRFARQALIGTLLISGLSWGVMTAASLYRADLEVIRIAMIIVAVGLCSAGTMVMAIDSFLKFWFPIVLILPISIGAVMNANDSNLLLAGLIFVYTLYVLFTSQIVHRDYWRALRASADLERASLTDALTQVANRMSFDRQYQREWRRASRRTIGLAVVMIDLDHFKKINDTYGHPAGDLVLQHVARAIEEALLRGGDYVARYGGEEFVVLLPQTDLDGASEVTRRILESFATRAVRVGDHEIQVTCSIGYAWTHPGEDKRPEDLLKLADNALYAAKAAGRNQAHYAT